MGAHAVQFFKFIYISDGSGTHRRSGYITEAGVGDLLVVAPGEMHDDRGLAGTRGFLIAFEADALDPGLTDADAAFLPDELLLVAFLRHGADTLGTLRVPPDERVDWTRRIESLGRELAERRSGYEEVVRAELRIFLVHCSRLAAARLNQVPPASRPLLSAVFRYVDSHFDRPISLADVAQRVGRSRAYLTDLVRRETGRTVNQWIVERRMAEARRLLLETDWEVRRIGQAVTYTDASYFIEIFKRLHGMTPVAWRAAQR